MVAVLCLCGLLSSCASNGEKNAAPAAKVQLLWPEPPDQPRFTFEATLRAPADWQPESDEERIRKMFTDDNDNGVAKAFTQPSSVAARAGKIYIADPLSKGVVVFDVPRRKVFRFGSRQPNGLVKPVSVAVDNAGKVYVLDSIPKKVMVFDDMGLFLFAVGKPGDFVKPVNVAVSKDGQKIYVTDRGSLDEDDHKIVTYAPDGRELFRIGPRGEGDGQLNIPLGVAVLPDGSLAALDSGNFRIQIFSHDGKYVRQFGGVGIQIGQFARPRSIASDGEGNIYVADGTFNNVQIFNAEGQLLMALGHLKLTDGPGHYGLISGIGVDETQRLYIIDNFFTKIEVFRRLSDQDGKAYLKKS